MTRQYLSKSKIMAGRQCEKRLWLEVRRPDLIEHGPDVEQRFAVGHDVNNVARAQYPGGVLISYDHGAEAAVEDTKRLMEEQPGTPIFEATFKAQDVLVRVDILKQCREGFELIEVKSSTSVKDHYYEDCAVQTWVLECAGIPVKAIRLCHIDNQFVYPGNGDYRACFAMRTSRKRCGSRSVKSHNGCSATKKYSMATNPKSKWEPNARYPMIVPLSVIAAARRPSIRYDPFLVFPINSWTP